MLVVDARQGRVAGHQRLHDIRRRPGDAVVRRGEHHPAGQQVFPALRPRRRRPLQLDIDRRQVLAEGQPAHAGDDPHRVVAAGRHRFAPAAVVTQQQVHRVALLLQRQLHAGGHQVRETLQPPEAIVNRVAGQPGQPQAVQHLRLQLFRRQQAEGLVTGGGDTAL